MSRESSNESYFVTRGYRLSAYELVPDNKTIEVLIIPGAQADIKRIREAFAKELTKPGFGITFWKGDVFVFSRTTTETKSKLKKAGFTNAEATSLNIFEAPNYLVTNNVLLAEFEKTIRSKGFLFRRRYLAYEPQSKPHANEDLIDLYDGFEYRIRYCRGVGGEGYFVLTLDYHLFVNFKTNIHDIITTLSKELDMKDVKDFLLGRLFVKNCPNVCPDLRMPECPLTKVRRRLSGHVREILFPDDENYSEFLKATIVPNMCPKLKNLHSATVPIVLCIDEEGNTYWISSIFLCPEPNLYNISEFVKSLKDPGSADSAVKDIRVFSFLDVGPRANPYASKDRFNAITRLLKSLSVDSLDVSNVCFNLVPYPLEVAV